MNASTTVSQFTANGAPIHPDGRLPKAQYIAWLKETGQYAPLTDEQKAERDASRAAKKAAKDAEKPTAPATKPMSEAKRKFFSGFESYRRREQQQAA